MRKKLILTAAVVAAFAACSATVSAVPISGKVDFGGMVIIQPNGSTLTGASSVSAGGWLLPSALDGTGSYSFVPPLGMPPPGSVTMAPMGWTFNSPFTPLLFSVVDGVTGNTWNFNADAGSSITFNNQDYLNVSARGTLTGPAGYDPTPGFFNFTTQTPLLLDPISGNYTASYSASAGTNPAVPDGGSTLMLLGTALGAFGLLRKRTAV